MTFYFVSITVGGKDKKTAASYGIRRLKLQLKAMETKD
jgi:hypothetical protein